MIAPKYAPTHYLFRTSRLTLLVPHVINFYLDYNCRFSAKLFLKLKAVNSALEERHPGKFEFVFVNVIQPWHPGSVFLNEYSLAVAQLLRDKYSEQAGRVFFEVSELLFAEKEKFFDEATVDLPRNAFYEYIHENVETKVKLPFSKEDVLLKLYIKGDKKNATNVGNAVSNDVKYFTKYLRGVGVHVTPTVSVDGVVDSNISSGVEPEDLVKIFEGYL